MMVIFVVVKIVPKISLIDQLSVSLMSFFMILRNSARFMSPAWWILATGSMCLQNVSPECVSRIQNVFVCARILSLFGFLMKFVLVFMSRQSRSGVFNRCVMCKVDRALFSTDTWPVAPKKWWWCSSLIFLRQWPWLEFHLSRAWFWDEYSPWYPRDYRNMGVSNQWGSP